MPVGKEHNLQNMQHAAGIWQTASQQPRSRICSCRSLSATSFSDQLCSGDDCPQAVIQIQDGHGGAQPAHLSCVQDASRLQMVS